MFIYNYPNQNISFEALNYRKFNGFSIPDGFKVSLPQRNGECADCFVKSTVINNPRLTDFSVALVNKQKEVGHMSSINNSSDSIKGIGSALHLTQIISMLENNITKTEIYSIGRAITFHARLGYKSNVQTKSEIKSFFTDEIFFKHQNNKHFSTVMSKIIEWFKDMESTHSEKIVKGNEIIDEFIQIINKNKLKYGVDYSITQGIGMKLEKEQILNNRECYNGLFDKYKIDYKINQNQPNP